MDRLPQTVEELLNRLSNTSRTELDLVRTLTEAVRRADEQMLRELRSLTLQHELRRESILDELTTLAGRLCALPAQSRTPVRHTIEQRPAVTSPATKVQAEPPVSNGHGGDWRKAAQNIQDELDCTFGADPRH